jgi:hypothetical protein
MLAKKPRPTPRTPKLLLFSQYGRSPPILLKPAILFVPFQLSNRSNYCEKENMSVTKHHADGSQQNCSKTVNMC